MEYTKLGNSDLEVSRVCLGCVGLEEDACAKFKYDVAAEADAVVIARVVEVAQSRAELGWPFKVDECASDLLSHGAPKFN